MANFRGNVRKAVEAIKADENRIRKSCEGIFNQREQYSKEYSLSTQILKHFNKPISKYYSYIKL